MADQHRIGFLGAGKMATALAIGWLRAGLIRSEDCRASDTLPSAATAFTEKTKIQADGDSLGVVEKCDTLVLAVKPQHMVELAEHIRPALSTEHLTISIAAGVPLSHLIDSLGQDRRIIRVMPNTPCLVGECAAAYATDKVATPEDVALTDRLFNAVGRAHRVPESMLDAVTGLSGSGPAYVFVMIEALSDGGVRMGLPRDIATTLAAQTVLGAAKLLLETGLHPGTLKDMVTSPGGTTITGLHALEDGAVRSALIDAVQAATERSAELADRDG